MKTTTLVRTTHHIALEGEAEYFEVQGSDGKVFRVEGVYFEESGDRTDLSYTGTYLLKSGKPGNRRARNYSTWEHSQAFAQPARQALMDTLPGNVVVTLREMGASI